MFIQISETEYVNLVNIAKVISNSTSAGKYSYHFFTANNVLIAQVDPESEFSERVEGGLKKYGLYKQTKPLHGSIWKNGENRI